MHTPKNILFMWTPDSAHAATPSVSLLKVSLPAASVGDRHQRSKRQTQAALSNIWPCHCSLCVCLLSYCPLMAFTSICSIIPAPAPLVLLFPHRLILPHPFLYPSPLLCSSSPPSALSFFFFILSFIPLSFPSHLTDHIHVLFPSSTLFLLHLSQSQLCRLFGWCDTIVPTLLPFSPWGSWRHITAAETMASQGRRERVKFTDSNL